MHPPPDMEQMPLRTRPKITADLCRHVQIPRTNPLDPPLSRQEGLPRRYGRRATKQGPRYAIVFSLFPHRLGREPRQRSQISPGNQLSFDLSYFTHGDIGTIDEEQGDILAPGIGRCRLIFKGEPKELANLDDGRVSLKLRDRNRTIRGDTFEDAPKLAAQQSAPLSAKAQRRVTQLKGDDSRLQLIKQMAQAFFTPTVPMNRPYESQQRLSFLLLRGIIT